MSNLNLEDRVGVILANFQRETVTSEVREHEDPQHGCSKFVKAE